jgi:putative spermidine/putrescine transport system substrate-binding protein
MTIVSWGGAYSASQQKAYHDPYMAANPGVNIINDESSAEAVAKLRAMDEAGNVTWDVVDVVASDAIRLCDEGLAMEIDFDAQLAPAPDGTPATEDFGDLIVSECFIPQIVYSTTFGYRTDVAEWNGRARRHLRRVRPGAFPGKRSAGEASDQQHGMGAPTATASPRRMSTTCSRRTKASPAPSPSSTDQGQRRLVVAGAETPQLLADGEVVFGSTYNGRLFALIEEQKQPSR